MTTGKPASPWTTVCVQIHTISSSLASRAMSDVQLVTGCLFWEQEDFAAVRRVCGAVHAVRYFWVSCDQWQLQCHGSGG